MPAEGVNVLEIIFPEIISQTELIEK